LQNKVKINMLICNTGHTRFNLFQAYKRNLDDVDLETSLVGGDLKLSSDITKGMLDSECCDSNCCMLQCPKTLDDFISF